MDTKSIICNYSGFLLGKKRVAMNRVFVTNGGQFWLGGRSPHLCETGKLSFVDAVISGFVVDGGTVESEFNIPRSSGLSVSDPQSTNGTP